MRRVNIGLADETHQKVKILSVLKNQPMNDILASAVEAYLRRHQKELRGVLQ